MLKSYKYKLNPNEDQKVLLNKHFGSIRFVYNFFLNERKREYETNKNSINFYDNSKSLIDICSFLNATPTEDWTKRIETHQLDFYTNDRALYDSFCRKFNKIIIQQFEPSEDTLELLKNQYTTIVKKLPHNKYRYKAFLRPHKMKGDSDAKQSYINWINSQGEKILMSDVVKAWFLYTDWNWDRRYLLVEDTATLLMLQMRSGDAIGKVYEYVFPDFVKVEIGVKSVALTARFNRKEDSSQSVSENTCTEKTLSNVWSSVSVYSSPIRLEEYQPKSLNAEVTI
jgi:hypothetical protein